MAEPDVEPDDDEVARLVASFLKFQVPRTGKAEIHFQLEPGLDNRAAALAIGGYQNIALEVIVRVPDVEDFDADWEDVVAPFEEGET